MLFDTHESKRLFLQAITTCCLVRSCQTLKHRIKAPKQNRHRNDRRVRKDARYLQQNQTEVFSVSTKICNNTQRKKKIKEKEKMKGLTVILLIHCTVKMTLTHHSTLQFFLYAFWLSLTLAVRLH